MIQLKIAESITYAIQTLIQEAGYIARISWPWLALLIVLSYVDTYILRWTSELKFLLDAFFCSGQEGDNYSFCSLFRYSKSMLSDAIYEVIPVMLYVVLLRYFILGEKASFYKPEIRLQRLYHTKIFRLGSYYFNFGRKELAYLLLSIIVFAVTAYCLSAGRLYFFQLGQTEGPFLEENIATRVSTLIYLYGNSILSTFFYTLLALVYADIAVNGFSTIKNIPTLIGRIRGNFLRLFAIIFIIFLPYEIMQQSTRYFDITAVPLAIFGLIYYIPSQIIFFLSQFLSIIIIARLYRKLYEPQTEKTAVQTS